jgi:V/A-type H+-transporting ATPase subunit E
MSGADKLKEKILAEAESQAQVVLEEAQKKVAAITAKSEQGIAEKVASLLEMARLQGDERRRRAKTIAELDARKAILAAKEKMIEDTFKQALTRLSAMDQQQFEDLLFPMLLAASETGAEEVIVSPTDRERFTSEYLGRVNQALTQAGKLGNLILSDETRVMQGGFILRAGDVEINSSFDSVLRMQRDQLEPEVAAILFS